MTAPATLANQEQLGRRVYSEKSARRARRGVLPYREFLEKLGETSLSVDRLTHAPADMITAIADRAAASRQGAFHGWATLTVEEADQSGRKSMASPLPHNAYHAHISLPVLDGEDREEQIRHAKELADVSRWRERA